MRKLVTMAAAGLIALSASAPAQAGDKELFGTILGAAGGGLLGAQVGKGNGRLAATAAGTFLGAVIGNGMGESLDRADSPYVRRGYPTRGDYGYAPRYDYGYDRGYYEPAPRYRPQVYEAPPMRLEPRYSYRPGAYRGPVRDGYDSSGNYCREYVQDVYVGGRRQEGYGTACMMPDGSWQVVR